MDRSFYLGLADQGLRMPIGTDLVLRKHADHASIIVDGERLGQVIEEAARTFRTPLAIPLMDLTVEKSQLLAALEVPEEDRDLWHLSGPLTPGQIEAAAQMARSRPIRRLRANIEAVRYIAERTDLVPCAMAIGPFSLMTKLLSDPIMPVYLAGSGLTGEEDADVRMLETALEASTEVILASIALQIEAGAKVCVIAEPAANVVYLSPKQLQSGSDVFDRCVMRYNRRIGDLLGERGVDLFFHCCGELTDEMVQAFASLNPVILSLGSSRKLWEDARLISKDIVLYGNLPTKRFFSDELSVEEVRSLARATCRRMREAGHPHILGSECDVLSVEGRADVIWEKVTAFLTCPLD